MIHPLATKPGKHRGSRSAMARSMHYTTIRMNSQYGDNRYQWDSAALQTVGRSSGCGRVPFAAGRPAGIGLWRNTRPSNGLITRSIPGGVARRCRQPAITATPRDGQSEPVTMCGARSRPGAFSASRPGSSRSAGTALPHVPERGCGSSARRWPTCSSGGTV